MSGISKDFATVGVGQQVTMLKRLLADVREERRLLASTLREKEAALREADDIIEQVWDIENGASIYLGHQEHVAEQARIYTEARRAVTETTEEEVPPQNLNRA